MKLITASILPKVIRKRPVDSFKGTYGKVALIGGNQNYGGAIIMSTLGTVSAGAGLTTTFTAPSNQSSLHAWIPEAMFADYQDQTLLQQLLPTMTVISLGSGLGTDQQALELIHTVFDLVTPHQTLLLDGSALTLIARDHLQLPSANIILTPHQMEWERLTGVKLAEQNPETNQRAYNQLAANQPHLIAVVKSAQTEVFTPTGAFQNTTGTPAQATGGMGDTLAGIVSGFAAQFADLDAAVLAAVYTHSAVADQLAQQQYVVLPHQISAALPRFMHEHQAE
ncbi:NAD(P)H-hydrate dehydratase [Fructilactobacillus myrtifloralis]|uniref:ADP-dependent (S)-NAD(P)H-hydrate dehydratase n=1 Tax=Fructilactobacillus myrtifloralis TaxID=2940301 RepID=A0ABY5BP64_9LACO|nr:NAD(P)H-hydrate dehydratase [Fructilactobacillus myrtifloralis]USS85452.1 NAD(P)H-hydrate dehydratase [Fructilactobacillus myrtifloralis]